ncbi:MAG TPA: hypothetical protein VKC64_13035 [Burkholderiales bacterium]|nr:hypothetical protein [Burkholderiales bacterium]
MRCERLMVALIAAAGIGTAHAQGSPPGATDWATFGRFLSLLQIVTQAAAASCPRDGGPSQGCDPAAGQKAIDDILNGRNADANAVMLEIFADVPQPEREKMLSIGRSLAAMSTKQIGSEAQVGAEARAIRARQDLARMGLTYYDPTQFLDAVRRGDVLAVRLFLAGRGVDVRATDARGNSALDLAQRGGNPEMIAIVSGAAARP